MIINCIFTKRRYTFLSYHNGQRNEVLTAAMQLVRLLHSNLKGSRKKLVFLSNFDLSAKGKNFWFIFLHLKFAWVVDTRIIFCGNFNIWDQEPSRKRPLVSRAYNPWLCSVSRLQNDIKHRPGMLICRFLDHLSRCWAKQKVEWL